MKNKKDLNLFKEVVHPENIVQVAAGWDFTLAVDDQGQVYGCGSNVFGQLGLGKEVKDVSEFMKISQITEKVVKVSAGMRHSLLLTEQGQLYACGSGKKGQFCNESDEIKINQFTPVPIKFDKKIKDIQTGQNFSVIIFTDGTFRAFGDDRHGQISSVNNFRDYNQVSQIQVGWTHVLFLLKTGHIQAYGRSDYGQISVRQNNLKFQQISSGYEHCLAISDQQNLYSWGWNEHGNCGLGHVDDVFEPTLIDFEGKYHVIRCFAGSGHSFVILQKRPNE